MVYSERKIEGTTDLTWMRNLPFRCIPPQLISNLKHPFTDAPLDPHLFHRLSLWYDECPSIWNSCLVEGDVVKVAMWGTFDPLIKEVYIKFVSATPDTQSYKKNLRDILYDEALSLRTEYQAEYIYVFSRRWRALTRRHPKCEALQASVVVVT